MRWNAVVLAALAILAAFVVSARGGAWMRGPAPGYVVAAQLLATSQFDERVYDDARYRGLTLAVSGGSVSDIYSPSPPTLALFVAPLAQAPGRLGTLAWGSVNLLLLLGTCALALRACAPAGGAHVPAAVLVLVVALVSTPLRENLLRGQFYMLQAFLHAVVLWSAVRRRDALAGVALGCAFAAKLQGWPLWILLLALRRWRAVGWAVATAVALGLLTLPLVGTRTWAVYLLDALPSRLAHPSVTVTAYQTVNSFWQHLLRHDAQWNPAPLWDAPWLAFGLALLTTAALLGLTLQRLDRLEIGHAVAAGSVLSLLAAPVAEQYHFLVLLAPFVVAATDWPGGGAGARAALVVAGALVAAPLPFKDPVLAQGALALLAYPRMYGALLLWALSIGAGLSSWRPTRPG